MRGLMRQPCPECMRGSPVPGGEDRCVGHDYVLRADGKGSWYCPRCLRQFHRSRVACTCRHKGCISRSAGVAMAGGVWTSLCQVHIPDGTDPVLIPPPRKKGKGNGQLPGSKRRVNHGHNAPGPGQQVGYGPGGG